MLRVSFIKEHIDKLKTGLSKRGWTDFSTLDEAIAADDSRKNIQFELDQLKTFSNKAAKEIGQLFKSGKQSEATEIKNTVANNKVRIRKLEEDLRAAKSNLENLLFEIPNLPHESVPAGKNESDNEVFKDWDSPLPDLGKDAKPHWDLAKQYDIIDFELGVKVTGAGFPMYKGKGAKLQRALISFFLDMAEEAGFTEIMPPLVVNEASARGTGQIPDKEGQMYYIGKDDLYLIPTAEVPITNIYREVILKESDFPIKMAGHTPCFRREAGSYGKDVKGLNRVHQFDKVELVCIEHPERSYQRLDMMVAHVESLIIKLGLPYRILRLCGGDLGFTSALTFDFEVYSAAQGRWLEVSSVSNFEAFQSNRLNLRYRDADNKKHLAHTLNGSALALARIVAAVLENYQTPEGIAIPEALRPYTRFDIID